MTRLEVPLHLPADQANRFLTRELRHREVLSAEVIGELFVVTHRRKSGVELMSCEGALNIIML